MDRDFVGYGGNWPKVEWPDGARLAISLCVNIEEGSELSPYFGDESQQPFGSESSARPPGVRSLATETLWEYGARSGGWRMLRMLRREGVKATFFVCGMALENNPPFARAITDEGHEVLGDGYRWNAQWGLQLEAERAYIRHAVEAIEQTTGQRPLGWFSRSGPSPNTREILKEQGFLYDSEALNDDLPYYVQVKSAPWLVVPYSFDSNDGMTDWHNSADFCAYLKDSFDVLYEEGATCPKMLSIGLHSKRSGKPGRIGAVSEFIHYAKGHAGVWFAGRDEIAHWWWEHYPPVR